MAATRVAVGAGAGAVLSALVVTTSLPIVDRWEGNVSIPYKDIVGVLTVCRGHTGPDVVVKKVYNDSECDELTKKDINKAIAGVLKVSPHLLWHPMQLVAATSFSFNVGTGTYAMSSVAREFNAGNFQAGCQALKLYTKAGGKFVQGLANRREHEYAVCVSTLTINAFQQIKVEAPG